MAKIWITQHKHILCFQDLPGFQLYTQTGTLKKGGHVLPTYRCARGSTLLENFHLHMNRFTAGVSGRQSCQVEGKLSYSGHAANQLSEEVLGRKLVKYTPSQKYTAAVTVCCLNTVRHLLDLIPAMIHSSNLLLRGFSLPGTRQSFALKIRVQLPTKTHLNR